MRKTQSTNSRALPSLNALRTFEAVARHRSMTLAAHELCVTPGAVSRQVGELERHLEVRLLVRSSSGLALTEHGEAIAASTRDALGMLAAVTGSLRQRGSRRLRIGVFGYFLSRAVFPLLPRLRSELPALAIEFHTSSNPLDLMPAAFDAVITVGEIRSRAGLVSRALLPIETSVVCSPALLEGRAPDFARLPLVHARPRPNDWRRWLDHAGFASVAVGGGSTFESISQAIEAASLGLGAAIAIYGLLGPDLDEGRIMVAHPVRRPTRRHFAFQYEAKRKHDTELLKLADWLVQAIAAAERTTRE